MKPLSRSCLVLGSAPDPCVVFSDDMDLICVNSSGYVARALGLPRPALTVLGGFKLQVPNLEEDRQAMRGLRTKTLLLITNYAGDWTLDRARTSLDAFDYQYDELVAINADERAAIVQAVTGERLAGEDSEYRKVTNGLFAACYAFHTHAPKVTLSGISFARAGHYYSDQNRPRQQIGADRDAVHALLARGYPLYTSEPELAGVTEIPLVLSEPVSSGVVRSASIRKGESRQP